jgi:hypothetical protein
MEDVIVIKASDLEKMFSELRDELKHLRKEIQDYNNRDEDNRTYTAKETAQKLSLNYYTIRRLVICRELQPVFVRGNSGPYRISAASIRAYIEKKQNKK